MTGSHTCGVAWAAAWWNECMCGDATSHATNSNESSKTSPLGLRTYSTFLGLTDATVM